MTMKIDLARLIRYILKRIWIPILCAMIGFGFMYWRAVSSHVDTYTAQGTMYVLNGNPAAINYQYTNSNDLDTAVMLVDTYKVIIKSNKVMDAVAERLGNQIQPAFLANSISMSSVSDTGVMAVYCTTTDPQLSMDICNGVLDIAPAEIIRVVSAGNVEVVDYAELPTAPNGNNFFRQGCIGGLAGGMLAGCVLLLLFMFNRKLTDSRELTENYTLPLLASILKQPQKDKKSEYLISDASSSQLLSGYGKLRMNLAFALHGKCKTVIITSAVPGESKSVLAANLAISETMDNRHVLLIDTDMRKPTQYVLFGLGKKDKGLSDALVNFHDEGAINIRKNVKPNLDVLTAGTIPPNPSELLNSEEMRTLLKRCEDEYDIIILDMPPINVVPDPLVLSDANTGVLYITRAGYSDHREIRRALTAAELTGANMLGMVMTCATRSSDGYYSYYYYKKYYGSYYDRNHKKSHRRHRHHHSSESEGR